VAAIVQVQREFGVPPAHAASGASGALSNARASTADLTTVTAAAATRAQISQTKAEFGFEK
jgi:hypothetical protein